MRAAKKTPIKITITVEPGSDLALAMERVITESGLSKPDVGRLGLVKVCNEMASTGSVKADRLLKMSA